MYKEYDFIVVGAGIVGPALAVGLARHGRSVLVLERSLAEPDRIVGELLQPGGIECLRELGMSHALEGIDAVPIDGYAVFHHGRRVNIPYPPFSDDFSLHENTKMGHKPQGRGFHHGKFVQSLRRVMDEHPNITLKQATVLQLIRNETTGHVLGVMARVSDPESAGSGLGGHGGPNGTSKASAAAPYGTTPHGSGLNTPSFTPASTRPGTPSGAASSASGSSAGASASRDVPFFAKVTMLCDGTNSKFRNLLSVKPQIVGYFVGLVLKNPVLEAPNRGHVIIGDSHKPILVYQIGTGDARILCDVPPPLPSVANGALKRYLEQRCLPHLPESMQASFKEALETQQLRSMPNQWLSAVKQSVPGAILLGDALNMRHPLTGGGMTAGFRDAVLLSSLLGPQQVNITDQDQVMKLVNDFTRQRRSHAAVINILSIALYRLFSAASRSLSILQMGCFRYFEFGGDCVRDPAALLSGLLTSPALLFYHFFAVAFWAIYYNYAERGWLLAPLAFVESFMVLYTAVKVFLPVFISELR